MDCRLNSNGIVVLYEKQHVAITMSNRGGALAVELQSIICASFLPAWPCISPEKSVLAEPGAP